MTWSVLNSTRTFHFSRSRKKHQWNAAVVKCVMTSQSSRYIIWQRKTSSYVHVHAHAHAHAHTHTHTLNGPFSGSTQVSRYQKSKTNLDLLEQETVSGSGISWAICKSAPCSTQTTTPVPHHSVFFTGRMPFLPPNQQRQSTEGNTYIHTYIHTHTNLYSAKNRKNESEMLIAHCYKTNTYCTGLTKNYAHISSTWSTASASTLMPVKCFSAAAVICRGMRVTAVDRRVLIFAAPERVIGLHIHTSDGRFTNEENDYMMWQHRSQELKEMLQGVLSIAIRADFWQPQKNERKAELLKYWHQRAATFL